MQRESSGSHPNPAVLPNSSIDASHGQFNETMDDQLVSSNPLQSTPSHLLCPAMLSTLITLVQLLL